MNKTQKWFARVEAEAIGKQRDLYEQFERQHDEAVARDNDKLAVALEAQSDAALAVLEVMWDQRSASLRALSGDAEDVASLLKAFARGWA
jgi:hypothetical protein